MKRSSSVDVRSLAVLTLVVTLSAAASFARAQDEAAAEALLAERGCLACHSLDGTPKLGPTFASAAGRARVVEDANGRHEALFDLEYVRRSIREPDVERNVGFPNGSMPRLARGEDDVSALAAAVMVLATRTPPAPIVPRSWYWLVLAALAFVLGHLVLSSTPVRRPMISRLGEGGFQGLYSLLVLGAFVWMVFEFVYAPYVELYRPPGWARWIPNVVMPISYVLLIAGYTTPSPTVAGMEKASGRGPVGFARITRHPALWGFALWGLSHLPPNGELRSLLVMGGIAALALLGMLHIDARRRLTGGEQWREFESKTSVVPFAAIARGQPWPTWSELGWWRIALGVAGWAVMLHLHRMVIGVSPLP